MGIKIDPLSNKQKEMESLSNPIMSKLYGQQGGEQSQMGGMPSGFGKDMNMPDLSSMDQKNNQDKDADLVKVAALLIHAAKIDQDYSNQEEEIIKQALIKLGANNQNIQNILTKYGINYKITNFELYRRAFIHKSYIVKEECVKIVENTALHNFVI